MDADLNALLEGRKPKNRAPRPLDSLRDVNDSWKPRAACRGVDVNHFFPGPGGSHKLAKETCSRCPVIEECREYAEVTQTEWGIWGGEARVRLSARERRALANGLAA